MAEYRVRVSSGGDRAAEFLANLIGLFLFGPAVVFVLLYFTGWAILAALKVVLYLLPFIGVFMMVKGLSNIAKSKQFSGGNVFIFVLGAVLASVWIFSPSIRIRLEDNLLKSAGSVVQPAVEPAVDRSVEQRRNLSQSGPTGDVDQTSENESQPKTKSIDCRKIISNAERHAKSTKSDWRFWLSPLEKSQCLGG